MRRFGEQEIFRTCPRLLFVTCYQAVKGAGFTVSGMSEAIHAIQTFKYSHQKRRAPPDRPQQGVNQLDCDFYKSRMSDNVIGKGFAGTVIMISATTASSGVRPWYLSSNVLHAIILSLGIPS